MAACREFIAAALLTATVLIGAMGEWLPVHWIAVGAEHSKVAPRWRLSPLRLPMPINFPCPVFAPLSGISGQQVLRNAKAKGLLLSALDETLSDIAKKNGMSPEKIYGLLFMK